MTRQVKKSQKRQKKITKEKKEKTLVREKLTKVFFCQKKEKERNRASALFLIFSLVIEISVYFTLLPPIAMHFSDGAIAQAVGGSPALKVGHSVLFI